MNRKEKEMDLTLDCLAYAKSLKTMLPTGWRHTDKGIQWEPAYLQNLLDFAKQLTLQHTRLTYVNRRIKEADLPKIGLFLYDPHKWVDVDGQLAVYIELLDAEIKENGDI